MLIPTFPAVDSTRSTLPAFFIALVALTANAQTTVYDSYPGAAMGGSGTSAGAMWGTGPGGNTGVGGAAASAQMHQLNGMVAGYDQAARKGLLMAPGNSITVQSIGNQTIINTSINGHNISSTVDADVSSSNSGAITNTASVKNTNNQ